MPRLLITTVSYLQMRLLTVPHRAAESAEYGDPCTALSSVTRILGRYRTELLSAEYGDPRQHSAQ